MHVEIYKNERDRTDVVPTVDGVELRGEPWLFGIDGAGTVQSRIDGAFGGTEMQGRCSTAAASQPRSGAPGIGSDGSAEGLAAAAGALRVRVVDREPGALEAVLVVERRAGEVLARWPGR